MKLSRMIIFLRRIAPSARSAGYGEAAVRAAWAHRKYLESLGIDLL